MTCIEVAGSHGRPTRHTAPVIFHVHFLLCPATIRLCGGDVSLRDKHLICVSGVKPYLTLSIRPWGHQIWRVVDAPLTQTNRWVVVSGVRETHSDANAAYKYISKSGYFKPARWSEQLKATTITYGELAQLWSRGLQLECLMWWFLWSITFLQVALHLEVAIAFMWRC